MNMRREIRLFRAGLSPNLREISETPREDEVMFHTTAKVPEKTYRLEVLISRDRTTKDP
jgi:hypothetical protein